MHARGRLSVTRGADLRVLWLCRATWCPPCVQTIPHLTELAHKYKEAVFVGVTNETESKVAPFVSKMGAKVCLPLSLLPQASL